MAGTFGVGQHISRLLCQVRPLPAGTEPKREDASQSQLRRCDYAGTDCLLPKFFANCGKAMTLRLTKISLVLAVAFFFTLVVFNNLNDYNTNYQFARHVLMMDSTVPGNHGMWRAISNPGWHTAFYIGIICWESIVMLFCWLGSWQMLRNRSGPAAAFEHSKRFAIGALTWRC